MAMRLLPLVTAAAMIVGLATAAPSAEKTDKKRLLVVTHTAGFRHDSIPRAEQVLKELGEYSGVYTADFCRNADEVKQMMTVENLGKYDGVIFANTTGDLGIPDFDGFLRWLRGGKAFIGAHSAADTYRPGQFNGDRRFIEMLGGEFLTHGAQCTVNCIVDDPAHSAVNHLGEVWTIHDEIYILTNNSRENVRVLLSLNAYPPDGSAHAGQPGDHLIAWVKRYGLGRVFYTALGHRIDVWENPQFQEHMLGGIKWSLGLAPGSAVPGNPQPKPAALAK